MGPPVVACSLCFTGQVTLRTRSFDINAPRTARHVRSMRPRCGRNGEMFGEFLAIGSTIPNCTKKMVVFLAMKIWLVHDCFPSIRFLVWDSWLNLSPPPCIGLHLSSYVFIIFIAPCLVVKVRTCMNLLTIHFLLVMATLHTRRCSDAPSVLRSLKVRCERSSAMMQRIRWQRGIGRLRSGASHFRLRNSENWG